MNNEDILYCTESFHHIRDRNMLYIKDQRYRIIQTSYKTHGVEVVVIRGLCISYPNGNKQNRTTGISYDDLDNYFETKIQRVKRIAKQLCK